VLTVTVGHLLTEKGRLAPCAGQVLQWLHDDAIPLQVDGDIEFALNRTPPLPPPYEGGGRGGWRVTLLNNRGVSTLIEGEAERQENPRVIVDPTREAFVRLAPKFRATRAAELLTGETPVVKMKDEAIEEVALAVPPGSVRVVEFSEDTSQ
jgi:hypothetical protein